MNIPYQNIEIEQIYSQILSEPGTSIAVCAANSGEGVTSIALALAQRNLVAGRSTLVVDLNIYRPAIKSLLDFDVLLPLGANRTGNSAENEAATSAVHSINTERLMPPQLVTTDNNTIALTGVTAPSKREHIMKLRQPGVLEKYVYNWLQQYDNVIIDTSPINRINARNIPPERVAAACDGAILVVLAGHTTEAMLSTAVSKLNTANAQLLGCIFNDHDNPSLKNELIREAERLAPRFGWLSKRLKKFLCNNRLLTLEI
ncbi:MAG: protein-tyrosine kinase [Moritella sp.]|jgi:protein-tyrosine kinase